jgi:cysteine desulfurase
VGALIVDKAVELEPLLHGGSQERGRRGGTENLAGIVGFGMAAELAMAELSERKQHMLSLRERFELAVTEKLSDAVVFGHQAERLPSTVFFAVPGIESTTLLAALDQQGFAVSSGSACGSSYSEPSPVLKAMGVEASLARCAIRVGLGKDNSEQDIDSLVNALRSQVEALKGLAAVSWA